MKQKNLSYRVLFREEPEGGFTVLVPALPGCITYGKNLNEARLNAQEAIELYIESLKAHGEHIPDESGTYQYNLTISV